MKLGGKAKPKTRSFVFHWCSHWMDSWGNILTASGTYSQVPPTLICSNRQKETKKLCSHYTDILFPVPCPDFDKTMAENWSQDHACILLACAEDFWENTPQGCLFKPICESAIKFLSLRSFQKVSKQNNKQKEKAYNFYFQQVWFVKPFFKKMWLI